MAIEQPFDENFVPGEPVPLEAMREIARQARRTDPSASSLEAGQIDEAGFSAVQLPPPGFWATITAQQSLSQPLYSFQEINDDGTTPSDGFSGTFNAEEMAGDTTVPVGAVVWMIPALMDEGWRFTYTPPVQLLQVNARTPDGSGHYDASVLSVDPATGAATVHESCWFVAPGTVALPVGAIFLGRFSGTFSSRNVYANHGPLIVELDSGSHATSTTFLDLHDPTFLVNEVSLGSGHARVRLNWGTNIQPVGTHNLPGISERPARADHVHAFAIPATTDPPSDTTGTTNIYNTATNMLWVYVTGIGWVPICPCPGWGPPSGSGSGSGSGTGSGGGGVVTSCCGSAVIPGTLYAAFTPTVDCDCLATVTVPLDYDPDFQDWRYAGPLCGQTVLIVFYCYDNPSWALEISFTSGSIANTDGPVSCTPFLWPESAFDLNFDGICAGFARVTISA